MTLRVSVNDLVARAEASGSPGLVAKAPGWERVPLGQVARVVNGATFKAAHFNVDGLGMPLLRIRDVGAKRISTWYDGPWEEKHRVRRGDLVVGMDGDFRADVWHLDDALLNQRVCRINIDERRIEPSFLRLALPGYLDLIWAATSAVTVKHLSSRSIAEIPLPLPERGEQRRIVEILEYHLSHLAAGLSSAASAEARASAMVMSAQTRLLRRAAETGLNATIGELAKVGTGTTPSRARKDFYDGGTIPWITSGDLSQGVIGAPTQWVTERALAETSLKLYPAGSLVLAMYGEGKTRGTVAELALPATTNQACAVLQVHNGALRTWVRAALDANYEAMRRMAAGGVQPNLNLGLVRAITIPVPDAVTRDRLLADVASVRDSATKLCLDVVKVRSRAAALRRAVLAAAFEGKLTGRHTDNEVIEERAAANRVKEDVQS